MEAGRQSTFTCMSESSNPATDLTWYADNLPQENTDMQQYTPGAYNGNITILPYRIDELSKDHNGVILQCGGTNQEISTCTDDKSAPCTLNVLCKCYSKTLVKIRMTYSSFDLFYKSSYVTQLVSKI